MQKDINNFTFKSGLNIEFEIISVKDLYKENREMITTPHRTTFYHIIWFKDYPTTHLVDFNPVHISKNALLFLNKDIVHQFNPQTENDGFAILFTDAFFSRSEIDTKFLKETPLFNDLLTVTTFILDQYPVFDQLFQFIHEEYHLHNDKYRPNIIRNYLHNFLLYAERVRKVGNFPVVNAGADLDYLLLYKDLIDISYKTHKLVRFYADKISVTDKRLNQATSRILGKTPKQVIDDRVVLEAKRLLAHTSASIKEIGYSLGFEEPTNFIKYFKKHNQVTPVEFRESLLSTMA